MVKLIKESNSSNFSPFEEEIETCKSNIIDIKHDIKTLFGCNTIADITNASWESVRKKYIDNKIAKLESAGKDFEAIQNEILEIFYYHRSILKDKTDKLEIANKLAAEEMAKLEKDLSAQYTEISNDGTELKFEIPEGASHNDAIAFADAAEKSLNGRYYVTGRGGSWSAWNLLSANKLEYQAGWGDNGACFFVKVLFMHD